MLKTTKITDPELYAIVEKELERQKYNIEMIAKIIKRSLFCLKLK